MTASAALDWPALRCLKVFDYQRQPKELLRDCPLCCAMACPPTARAGFELDRYGYGVDVAHCECGLVYLRERMTKEAYVRFYETAYRSLVSAFHGREINALTIQQKQREYGKRLAKLLKPWNGDGINRHLDIGGSTGIVADVLSHTIGLESTVLDPSAAELYYAQEAGLEIMLGTVETLNWPDRRWDLVTMCQTADHLLDLMGSLKKIRGLLSGGGLFWSDIVNFAKTQEVKIDHPFNLTEKTYREFLRRAGFELLQVNYAEDGIHVGFLCRAAP